MLATHHGPKDDATPLRSTVTTAFRSLSPRHDRTAAHHTTGSTPRRRCGEQAAGESYRSARARERHSMHSAACGMPGSSSTFPVRDSRYAMYRTPGEPEQSAGHQQASSAADASGAGLPSLYRTTPLRSAPFRGIVVGYGTPRAPEGRPPETRTATSRQA